MRLIRDSALMGEESASSSVQSTESYGIFGSACSDTSDCEYVDAGNPLRRYNDMPRLETSPLLTASPRPTSAYKTICCSDSLGPGEISGRDIIETYTRLEKIEKEKEKKKQSSLVTIFSVWNTIMGSSLLTMAWGVARAGLPTALGLVAVMAALCLYTAHLLLRVNHHHGGGACEVPALCRRLLGRGAQFAAHTFSLLALLGASLVYWLLMSNFLYHTVNYIADLSSSKATHPSGELLCPKRGAGGSQLAADPSPYWGLHTTVPFYVAIGIYPLMNFTNVTFFTKFNSLGTLSVAYLVVFVLWKGWWWGTHDMTMPTFAPATAATAVPPSAAAATNAAALSGILALSFYIHNIIITIMSHNRRQENNGRDLTIAFLLVTITYTLVGAVFYICFPLDKSCIEDNILNNFDMHDTMTAVARALLLFQVVTVYPLVAFMLRSEAVHLLPLRDCRALTLAVNAFIVALCVLVACLCPNIGTVIRYTGAVCGLVHVFALPAALRLRSLQLRGRLGVMRAAPLLAIAAAGAANLLAQFFITD
ncbi:unnamed protein product, partial [Iphiclides podalirius]